MMGKYALVSSLAFLGFIVGFGIGQETRKAADSNVDAGYSDGIVTIKANVGGALKQGVSTWLESL